MLFRKALIRGLPLALLLAWAGAGHAQSAPEPVRTVAVFPFTPRRDTEQGRLLAAFAQQALRRSLIRAGTLGVMDLAAAGQWQARFKLEGTRRPTAAQLKEAGVEAVVHGTSQLVLGLAVLEVRVTGAAGGRLAEGARTLRVELGRDPPRRMVERLQALVWPALTEGTPPAPTPQPERWEPLLDFLALAQRPLPAGPGATDKRLAELDAMAAEPALEGRVRMAQAGLLLEHALKGPTRELARRKRLEAALGHANTAVQAEPWNPDALALRGEIHFFLKQYYEAKTDASVARLKNPLSGLANVVLALQAGLSTGAAAEHMKHALASNPFLRGRNQRPGEPPFQGGVLEPYFATWERLQHQGNRMASRAMDPLLKEGIAAFEQEHWNEAAQALRKAADKDSYDYRPLLYLSRIVIETGDPLQAAHQLRQLDTEFPEQPEILFFLGIAYERGQDYPSAIHAFRLALELDPGHALALFHLGTSALANEQWQAASEVFGRVLDKDEDNAGAWLRYGIANARMENWRIADEAFHRTLELEPGSKEAKEWLAWIQPRMNQ